MRLFQAHGLEIEFLQRLKRGTWSYYQLSRQHTNHKCIKAIQQNVAKSTQVTT